MGNVKGERKWLYLWLDGSFREDPESETEICYDCHGKVTETFCVPISFEHLEKVRELYVKYPHVREKMEAFGFEKPIKPLVKVEAEEKEAPTRTVAFIEKETIAKKVKELEVGTVVFVEWKPKLERGEAYDSLYKHGLSFGFFAGVEDGNLLLAWTSREKTDESGKTAREYFVESEIPLNLIKKLHVFVGECFIDCPVRSRDQITYDVLSAVAVGRSKLTHILQKAKLVYYQADRILKDLLEKGLLNKNGEGYKISRKGLEWMRQYETLKKIEEA